MIDETAAVGIVERPTLRVDDGALVMVFGFHVPKFFNADSIDLRLAACIECEALFQLLAEVAAYTFGEQRVFRMKFETGLVRRLVAAITRNTEVARGNPLTAPFSSNRISAAGKPGKISTPSASACDPSQRQGCRGYPCSNRHCP